MLLDRDWILFFSGVASGLEAQGGLGDTHEPPAKHCRVGVFPRKGEGGLPHSVKMKARAVLCVFSFVQQTIILNFQPF